MDTNKIPIIGSKARMTVLVDAVALKYAKALAPLDNQTLDEYVNDALKATIEAQAAALSDHFRRDLGGPSAA
jgi:hypothetical protein